ncbi:MAG TPA: TIGR02680 family protein [Streptosporangiaceae bacterium]|nr:TIGR02680 family protein [Streptosporangiaceae bacterium]
MTVTELVRLAATPEPERGDRWLPSRAGILNIWRYYDEVFTFHDGRLLLRGPNGSGKSKALELLLPFLFDANLRASRLSTFGTGERTMHWNLMGEGASGTTRVGYVWLEFGRADPARPWFTCGCRLQASTHTTTVGADYFTTSRRIGTADGVSLVNEAGQPLTRTALGEALGADGEVFGNAGDYRTAVRHALFPGLSEQRYEALMTALLQLRMPKLSQRLDPALLSSLLSHALPPLGRQEISDLAEGFERLDQQRERLATLDEEVKATRALADRQRTYAQRVLRAASAAMISATSTMDTLTRTARTSAQEYDSVAASRAQARNLVAALAAELGRCRAEIDGLTESEAYQQGRELDQLRQQVAAEHGRAARLRADATARRSEANGDEAESQVARRDRELRAETVRALETQAKHAAVRAGVTSVHAELAQAAADERAKPRQLLRAAVQARLEQVAAVRAALAEHDQRVARRQDAEAGLEAARTAFAAAMDQRAAAGEGYEAALSELTTRLAQWMNGCRELVFADPDALLDLAEAEADLVAVVESVAGVVIEQIATAQALAASQHQAATATRAELAAELAELTAARDLPPAAPATRTADRSIMAGAPLWRIVDFKPSVPPEARGPIEAALAAAGLLDAWVGPAGTVQGHDTFADPAALAPAPGRSLADVLGPEPDSPVPAEAVARLLACIAYDERLPAGHAAAIGADGSWRLGNAHGSWYYEQPSYIGASARQRARRERLRELSYQVGAIEQAIAALDAELAGLRTRRAALANERALRPGHAGLDAAALAVTRADSELTATDNSVRHQVSVVRSRESEVAAALRELTALGAEHGLPTERGALDGLAGAIGRFSEQAENWLDEIAGLAAASQRLLTLLDKSQRSAAMASSREEEAADAQASHGQLAAKLAAVEQTVGADYRDVLARLAAARAKHAGLDQRIEATRAEQDQLTMRLGELESARASDAVARDRAIEDRDAAAHRFRHLASGVLAADSGLSAGSASDSVLSGSDGVRAALEAARLAAAAWPNVPHEAADLSTALHRLSESVHACRTTLSARADLDLEVDADVQVFTAVIDGVRVGAAELLTRLAEDAKASRQEITDRERELFDRTLTGDTRRHLADRIRQANELVDRMNARLERVRTASRVAVRLVWQVAPDLPAGTRAARDLLLKDPVRLTDADRDSLHVFFRDRIEQAKADNTAASWEQQLEQVFDYTSWHRFDVKIDRANGAGWQLLTRKLHGALSGGEKAIALHLPLFAAVAAHYQAVPVAPRVILLDEVFVGVDSNNRGQVFALLSALDLDLMLTSDHEWCTYAELSGISIHQLITGDGDDAVTTARFTWNGHDLTSGEPEPEPEP